MQLVNTMAASGIDIGFGIEGRSREFTVSGWSDVEQQETWSVDGQSVLALPAPQSPAAYYLLMHLRPYTAPGKVEAQRMRITVNGTAMAEFHLSRPGARACRIPWCLIDGRETLHIRLDFPDAAQPSAYGGSDTRQLGVAFSRLLLFADAAGEASATEPPPGERRPIDIDRLAAADRLTLRELMLQFESLGQNCEFGLVQRQCGADPLGLLRFSSTPLPNLLNALDARFAGMGRPDSVRVEHSCNGRELMVHDSRYGFVHHAFVKSGAMAAEEVHAREIKRVPLLVRKLIEDLEAAEKIFVFKGMGMLQVEQVYPLAAILRRYADNTLLFVTLADPAHPAGRVEQRAPGFLVGHLTRFAPMENAQDFELAQWVRLCREAIRQKSAEAR
jgi:hypothetical protein